MASARPLFLNQIVTKATHACDKVRAWRDATDRAIAQGQRAFASLATVWGASETGLALGVSGYEQHAGGSDSIAPGQVTAFHVSRGRAFANWENANHNTLHMVRTDVLPLLEAARLAVQDVHGAIAAAWQTTNGLHGAFPEVLLLLRQYAFVLGRIKLELESHSRTIDVFLADMALRASQGEESSSFCAEWQALSSSSLDPGLYSSMLGAAEQLRVLASA
ncbi:hypothetical protein BC828DRAFT_389944 [Blastocladiella britannica]|nr:hypothetical protein BC828DRAFT_389944 [Blastocladiella britannica]